MSTTRSARPTFRGHGPGGGRRQVTALRAVAPVVLAATVAMSLGACGGDPDATAASGPDTLSVETEFGAVDLPSDPRAAFGMYTTDLDILVALGVPLADQQGRRSGYDELPSFFPQEVLAGVETFPNYPEFNYEQIAAAEPDLILNGLGYDATVVDRLPGIAPTYSFDGFDGTYWLEHFEEIARDLGRTDRYEAWVATYEGRVAEIAAQLDAEDRTKVFAPLNDSIDGEVTTACYVGVQCAVFEDLGLQILPAARANDNEGTTFSTEELGRLSDLDVAVMSEEPGAQGERALGERLDTLDANPTWAALPFVQAGEIHGFDLEMNFGSPSGQMAFLEVVADILTGD